MSVDFNPQNIFGEFLKDIPEKVQRNIEKTGMRTGYVISIPSFLSLRLALIFLTLSFVRLTVLVFKRK